MDSECLECRLGNTRLAVPLSDIELIAEYTISPPPPLAEPWVGGYGIHENMIFVSLAPRGSNETAGTERKGLIIRQGTHKVRWALEVDVVGDIGRYRVQVEEVYTVPKWVNPRRWLLKSTNNENRELPWLNIKSVLSHLEAQV